MTSAEATADARAAYREYLMLDRNGDVVGPAGAAATGAGVGTGNGGEGGDFAGADSGAVNDGGAGTAGALATPGDMFSGGDSVDFSNNLAQNIEEMASTSSSGSAAHDHGARTIPSAGDHSSGHAAASSSSSRAPFFYGNSAGGPAPHHGPAGGGALATTSLGAPATTSHAT